MANEIVKKTERYILVQTDLTNNLERVMVKSPYGGGYITLADATGATGFEEESKAKQIADALNTLYQLTGDNYEIKVVHEVIDRTFVDGGTSKSVEQ